MEIMIVFLIISIFGACRNNEIPININIHSALDTLHNDAFVENKFISEDRYQIEWGTSKFTNITKDTFGISGSGSLEFDEEYSNSKYLVTTQLCGSGCTRYVILPLQQNATELDFMDVEYINTFNNLIITTINPSSGDFLLTNFATNQMQKIEIKDMCPAADKSMCIDSIFLQNNQIVIKYQGNKWEANKPDNKVRVVELN